MSRRHWMLGLLALLALMGLLLPTSCSSRIDPPHLVSDADPHDAWARNLAQHVDEEGRIDFTAMEERSEDLDTFVAWLAKTPTESIEGRDERIAHYINAYNGLAMYAVLHASVRPKSKVRFFYFCELMLGGEWISLYDLENDVIRPLGEERVHFALNCMVRACPRLPQLPFSAAELEAQLEAAAREFANSPRHVLVDDQAREIRLSKILEWYEKDFLAVAPDLVSYLNRYREEALPAGYEVVFDDYDWTLNQR